MNETPLRLALAAMGTRFELALLDGSGDLRAAGEAALEEILIWHQRLNRYAGDSLLSHIVRTAPAVPVRLDRDTWHLFHDALAVWQDSGGAFDITIAAMMVRSGFQDSAVPAAGGRVGAGAITLDPASWTIRLREGTTLDLGGIAKGHALDCAAALLRRAGVTRALLHGGTSSVVAIGGAPSWRIAVGPEPGAFVVDLREAALSISDPSSQRAEGTGHTHIVDPRSGGASVPGRRVVVVGPSARLADAWSTALAVLRHVPPGFPPEYIVRFCPGAVEDVGSKNSSARTPAPA